MKIDAHLHSFLDSSSLFASYPQRDASDIIAFLEKKYYHDRPDRQQAIEYAIETLVPSYKLIYGSDYPHDGSLTIKTFYEKELARFQLTEEQQEAIWSRTIMTILQL